VVVLDEFQYLMGTGDDVISHLVAVWDRELKNKPLTLVLSGSQVATMERSSAATGRYMAGQTGSPGCNPSITEMRPA
jgi:hypothetical protein